MKADVVVSNQHDQFRVSGVSEHSVEAPHVVLPVLRRNNHTNSAQAQTTTPLGSWWELMGSLGVTQSPPWAACDPQH